MSIRIPRSPGPGEPVKSDWARAVTDALRAMQPSGGSGIAITYTPAGIVISALPQKQPQAASAVSAGKGYPYGSKWAFGFEASAEKKEGAETFEVTVAIHNIDIGTPTFAAAPTYGDYQSIDSIYIAGPTRKVLDRALVNSVGETYLYLKYDATATGGAITLQQSKTREGCKESLSDAESGVAFVRLFRLTVNLETGACDIATSFIHKGFHSWL